MSRTIFALLSLVLVACEEEPVGMTDADYLADEALAPPVLDPCRTQAADASTTLTIDDDADTLASIGAGYATRALACKRFIADFRVNADASPADIHGIDTIQQFAGSIAEPNQATCSSWYTYVSTYRKAPRSASFTQVSSATYRGVWQAGLFSWCEPVRISGADAPDFEPNPAGVETRRIAVSSKINNVWQPVDATIAFQIIPW